jgi:hypothetical protein
MGLWPCRYCCPIQSLFRSLLSPCSFPVTNSVNFKRKAKKGQGIEAMRALAGQTADIFPVFFPVNGNFCRRRVRW